jgi:hypothetical protein
VAASLELETDGRDPRNWINEQTENNKMQLTRSGHPRWRPSQLILVFSVPNGDDVEVERAPLKVDAPSRLQHLGSELGSRL